MIIGDVKSLDGPAMGFGGGLQIVEDALEIQAFTQIFADVFAKPLHGLNVP
jgi:hypothetical protein